MVEKGNGKSLSESEEQEGTRSRRKRPDDEIVELSRLFMKKKSPQPPRKSLRSRVLSAKAKNSYGGNGNKSTYLKSRSRRYLLKKQNTYYHVGDIVSLLDVDDGIYYAQLRGLASDSVGDNCCFLTWLVPITENRDTEFKPEQYILAMEEDIMRDISCCKLVCRCPSDYFQPLASPYTTTRSFL